MKKTVALILVCLSLTGVFSACGKTQDDPIACWNADSPTVASVISFAASVTDENSKDFVPEEKRIAVVDMDGTLYGELFPTYFDESLLLHRLLHDESYQASEEVLTWAKEVLAPAADLAFRGGGDFNCGSWCRFCRAKSVCRKRAEENLALARYDFARPDTLEDDEINAILGKLDPLITWAEDIKAYALHRALSGYAWDDWKAVEGRSNRTFTDEESVAAVVTEAGFNPYEKKLLGITAMEKLLGKNQFRELLGSYVTRPQGKPTLVSRSDKRPELVQAK